MSFHLQISDTLELREHQPEQAEELFALTERNRAHLRRWMPWLDACTSPDHTRKKIESTLRAAEEGLALYAGMWCAGRLVGTICFSEILKLNRTGHIGYWLDAAHTGRGIVTMSVRALASYGFGTLGLNRLVIAAATGNRRSRAIPERLGFELEGIARETEWLYDHFEDHAIYAKLQRHWNHGAPTQSAPGKSAG